MNQENKVIFEPTLKPKTRYKYYLDKLAFIGSTEKTDGTTEFSYEASFKLSTTDQTQVIIPAGTELNYTIAATEETELETFTLHLENELRAFE